MREYLKNKGSSFKELLSLFFVCLMLLSTQNIDAQNCATEYAPGTSVQVAAAGSTAAPNTDLFVLTDAAGTILDVNNTGLFDPTALALTNDTDYNVHVLNYDATDATTTPTVLPAVGGTIAGVSTDGCSNANAGGDFATDFLCFQFVALECEATTTICADGTATITATAQGEDTTVFLSVGTDGIVDAVLPITSAAGVTPVTADITGAEAGITVDGVTSNEIYIINYSSVDTPDPLPINVGDDVATLGTTTAGCSVTNIACVIVNAVPACPTDGIAACVNTPAPAAGTSLSATAANPTGGAAIANWDGTAYTAQPGDAAGTIEVTVTDDVTLCTAVCVINTPACPLPPAGCEGTTTICADGTATITATAQGEDTTVFLSVGTDGIVDAVLPITSAAGVTPVTADITGAEAGLTVDGVTANEIYIINYASADAPDPLTINVGDDVTTLGSTTAGCSVTNIVCVIVSATPACPTDGIVDCVNTPVPAAGTSLGATAANPTGGAAIANWDGTAYTALPGDVAGTIEVTVTDDVTLCTAVCVIATPACPQAGVCSVVAGDPTTASTDICPAGTGPGDGGETELTPTVVDLSTMGDGFSAPTGSNAGGVAVPSTNYLITDASGNILDVVGNAESMAYDLAPYYGGIGDQFCIYQAAYTQETIDNIANALNDFLCTTSCIPLAGCVGDLLPGGCPVIATPAELAGVLDVLNDVFTLTGNPLTAADVDNFLANQQITIPTSQLPGGLFPDIVFNLADFGLDICGDLSMNSACYNVVDCSTAGTCTDCYQISFEDLSLACNDLTDDGIGDIEITLLIDGICYTFDGAGPSFPIGGLPPITQVVSGQPFSVTFEIWEDDSGDRCVNDGGLVADDGYQTFTFTEADISEPGGTITIPGGCGTISYSTICAPCGGGGCELTIVGANSPICESDVNYTIQVADDAGLLDVIADGGTWTIDPAAPAGLFTVNATGGVDVDLETAYAAGTATAGTYTIQYTDGAGECVATEIITIVPSINACDIDFSSVVQNQCFEDITGPITLPNTLGGTWYYNGAALATDELTVTSFGVYTLTYVVGEDLCQTECAYTVNVIDCSCTPPVATIDDATTCVGSSGQYDLTSLFNGADNGGIFLLDDGAVVTLGADGTPIDPANASITVNGDVLSYTPSAIADQTTIDVAYSVGVAGCASVDYATVTLVPQPAVDIDLPSGICLGESITLTDYLVSTPTNGATVTWVATDVNGAALTITAGAITPTVAGNVSVCYTETIGDCVDTDCDVLGVSEGVATIEDATVCAGSTGQFDLTSLFNGADQGGVFTADAGTVAGDILSYDLPVNATITANVTYTVCGSTDTAVLTIEPGPAADLDLPSSFCSGDAPDLDDYLVPTTTDLNGTFTAYAEFADIPGTPLANIINADNTLNLSGFTSPDNIIICYEIAGTGGCENALDCEVVGITQGLQADLLVDGMASQTYCLGEFLDFGTIDLTQYLAEGTGGSGYFTIAHADSSVTATYCVDGPSYAGCVDGFIWNVEGAAEGQITVTYTIDADATCPQMDMITINLIEPATDCLDIPSIVCENEAGSPIDANNWYDPDCGDCIKTWNSLTDGGQDQYSVENYADVNATGTQIIAGTYDPNSIPGCNPFIQPDEATNSVTLPEIPTGATVLSLDFMWDYQPTCELAEGDIDSGFITFPDGSSAQIYGNAGGPGSNGNDHFGWQMASYAFNLETGLLELTSELPEGTPMELPATLDPAQFADCETDNDISYALTSNAANFTIGFEASITWATCVFEAYLHETVDADGNQIDPIQLPSTEYGITAGFIDNGDGTWSFDANGLDTFGEVDIVFYELNCSVGGCLNPQTETVIFVDPVGAAATGGEVCQDAGQIDLTQFLDEGSDNGGIFTSADATINGDILDVTSLDGAINITYTLQDGVANGCGVASVDFIVTVNVSGDASGLTFAPYYCEGTDVTLPGDAAGSWDILGATYAGGDVLSTAGLSVNNPVQATYTIGEGQCADSETYLIVIESSYDAVLAESVSACASDLGGALIMNSNGCIDMDQFVLPNADFGAGYWEGPAGLSGAIFCPAGPGSYDFTFTVPGSGDCGAVRSFNITISEEADASFDIETVVCASDGDVDLSALVPDLVQSWNGQICMSGDDVEIVSPSFDAPDTALLVLPALPADAIITNFTLDYSYTAGPGNPNADGDLDLLSITTPDGVVLQQWLDNEGPLGNDNHFPLGSDVINFTDTEGDFAFDVNSLLGCSENEIVLAVVSNSAYWDACIDVTLEYTTGSFDVYLSESGESLEDAGIAGGVSYNGAGSYTLDVSSLCEVNDVTIEFTRFDCACSATSTDVIEVLCGADAVLADDASFCYTDDIDLTQFILGTTGGTFSGDGVQGESLVAGADGGTFTITYTVGSMDSPCGMDTDEIVITVAPSLDPSWDAPGTLCLNESYDLAAYITGTTGGSFTGSSDLDGSNFAPTSTGLVNITYSVSSGDCTEGWTEVINVIGEETASIPTNLQACDSDDPIDLSATLMPTPEGGTWSGAGVAGGWFNPTNLSGTYTLTYTVGEGSCISSTTTDVTVSPGPDASWTSPVEVCADMPSFNLNNYVSGNAGGSWSANVEGAVSADGSFDPSAAGASATEEMIFVQVTYSVTEGACTATETEVIAVAYVDPYFDMPASACVGDVVTITANVPGHWWTGADATEDGNATFTATEAGTFNVTYSTGGLICHKTYTATITVCDVPAAPAIAGEGLEVCEGGELGMISVAGSSNDPLVDGSDYSFFEYYTVTYNGETYSGGIYYGQTLEFDPTAILGEDFTGTASLEIASVNQCGCSSDPVTIDVTVNPTPVIEYILGCTDPQSNLAALEVVNLASPFQIAVYPEGQELTEMSYNPMDDPLAIIAAGEVYNIAVIDENGCAAITEGVVAEFAVDFAAAISCIDDNGMVTVSIDVDENTGYGAPYAYSYDGGLTYTDSSEMMLAADANPNISVVVRDDKGCLSGFQTFTLGENGSLAPTATCADENGIVTIDLGYSGSDFSATYSIDGGAAVDVTSSVFDLEVLTESTIVFTVIDNSSSAEGGCELVSEPITIAPALSLTVSPSDECPIGGVETSFLAEGGSSPYALSIDGVEIGSFSVVSVETLAAGTYDIMITDANGCTASESVTIEDIVIGTPTLVYNSSLSSATSVCGDEALTLTVAGGSSYTWAVDGVAQDETGDSFTTSYSGASVVTVAVSEDGCVGDALEIPITYYAPLANTEPVIVCNGDNTYTVSFTITGGNLTQPYFVSANGVVLENFGTVTATYDLDTPFSFDISSPESGCSLNVSGADECEDPSAGQGCFPTLSQGNLDCETGMVTIFVSNAGPDFDVESITGGATTDVNVDSDGFGNVQVSFTLDDTNIGNYTMTYNPGGVQCNGTSTFDISVDCNDVTAIELLRFDGEVLADGNNLFWTTANEIDSDFFTLERSEDGTTFKPVGTVVAKGNSTVNIDYNFLDAEAAVGTSYYRLLETDVNGITRIVSQVVDLTRTAEGTFGVVSVYPVPTSNSVTIEFNTMNGNDLVKANIFDVTGKLVDVIDYTANAGVNEMNINVADYAAGTYFVTMIQNDQVSNTKFIKE